MAKVVTGLRPGGRSERIQTAVHQAVKELQKDFEQSQITIPMIAVQAGVTPSTIYRRWGDINQLFSDVALNELKPDMGHCCKVSDEAAFCLIQRPYISKTLLTRRISP
ncbi:TetR family transcriptional regulator, partial [Acinetobacter baumannii]|uniref:TetR family transcriptional regulator n=1 Tax=Acinetobacter baumannii TaxID=470 RepID=UPI003908DA78